MSIDIAEYSEIFVETMGIVLGEIRVEYGTSFFYEKRSLLAIDELPDIFSSLCGSNKR